MFTLILAPLGFGLVLSLYSELRMVLRAAATHIGWLLGCLAVPTLVGAALVWVGSERHLSTKGCVAFWLVATLLAPLGTLIFVVARWYAAREHALVWFGGRMLLLLALLLAESLGGAGTAKAVGFETPTVRARSHDSRPDPRFRHRPGVGLPSDSRTTTETRPTHRTVGTTGEHAGSLVVTSNVNGAPITLDGSPIGVAPFTRDGVAPGHHVLACHLAGFEPFTFPLDLAPSDVVAVNVRLDPKGPAQPGAYGFLSVDDATPGREVRVFGDVIGNTPFVNVPVPSGVYDIVLVAADGSTVGQQVIVDTQQSLRVVGAPAPPVRAPRR